MGCPITSRLRNDLLHSALWREWEIDCPTEGVARVRIEGNFYLGRYIPSGISFAQVEQEGRTICQAIERLCPRYREKIHLQILAQPFIGAVG